MGLVKDGSTAAKFRSMLTKPNQTAVMSSNRHSLLWHLVHNHSKFASRVVPPY